MFAGSVPGLGQLLAAELTDDAGLAVTDSGRDGRSDLVLFEAEPSAANRALGLDLAEDVFVEVGRTLRADGDDPRWIAARIWRPERVSRALAVWTEVAARPRGRVTFRVIVRVLQERSFLRTDLRRELTGLVSRAQPAWRMSDPARLEVWIVEYRPGRIIAGLRLSDVAMRQHDGRAAERPGALRPTVAAAMVRLAGQPGGLLLDPCCGSGTILAEGRRRRWRVWGGDIDPEAVAVARRNLPEATVEVGDARALGLPDRSVGAVVSNLPFGRQFTVDQDPTAWQRSVLREAARVTRPGGRVVLLAPRLPRTVVPATLRASGSHRIRLLGTWTSLWCYDRIAG
jgi:SAM-dependent methyltransferase